MSEGNCNLNEKLQNIEENRNDIIGVGPFSNTRFTVNRACIPTVNQKEQENELSNLSIEIYQQEVLEKEIISQVDKALENEAKKKAEESQLQNKKRKKSDNACDSVDKGKIDEQTENFNVIFSQETEKEKKIRMGEMTPFGTVITTKRVEENNFENIKEYFKKQIDKANGKKKLKRKHTELGKSKILNEEINDVKKPIFSRLELSKPILRTIIDENFSEVKKSSEELHSEVTGYENSSGSEYIPSESGSDDNFEPNLKHFKIERRRRKKLSSSKDNLNCDSSVEKIKSRKDDGNKLQYLKRLDEWEKMNNADNNEINFRNLGDGFKIPTEIWHKLYNYQKVGVQWLWELHLQRCGGILGDEMGLGKTIQVIAFLIGLKTSKLISRHSNFQGLGPVLIICPTTVMHQWVREFHQWWPPFRVALLHETGNYNGKKNELMKEMVKDHGILITSYVTCIQKSNDLLRYNWHYVILDEGHKIRNPESQISNTVKLLKTPHRLILSGSPMQNNLKELWSLFDFIFPGKLGTLPVFMAEFGVPITQGGYANASKVQVATAYKCATVLRDTISPYLLRRAKEDVKSHINLPPKNEQVLFCKLTEEQRELYISYLNSGKVTDILRGRTRVFVGLIDLRKICNHPHLYTGGPKLLKTVSLESIPEEERFGFWKKAGKMIVVETLLKIWKKQGHRVLIFTQSRKMLQILESFISSHNYEYVKIDGTTSIGSRQPLINKFNEDTKYFIFLSTTHVGGLGVNLTGANRVVIYDPDWNPATDVQARERAWRIGQENQVTIYRLVTSGTIEEKIYHRQIFKQFLTNKVLKDPSQRRFFKSNDLYELFTLKDDDGYTETSAVFAGTNYELNLKDLRNRRERKIKDESYAELKSVKNVVEAKNILTKEKIEKMKQMAQILSRKITLDVLRGNSAKEGSKDKTDCPVITDQGIQDDVLKFPSSTGNAKIKKTRKKSKGGSAVVSVEGEIVPHLQKQKPYRNIVKKASGCTSDDDYILKKLFLKSGVHSALKHDQIMESGSADYALIEEEAEKIAKDAVKALKESRKAYMRTVTDPQPRTTQARPRFGRKSLKQQSSNELFANECLHDGKQNPMSSSELLLRIRQRNGLCPVILNMPGNPINENSELLADIRNFISFGAENNSKATTQEIIDRFRNRLPTGQTPLFKALLSEICEFRRASSGEGIWELRPEFCW